MVALTISFNTAITFAHEEITLERGQELGKVILQQLKSGEIQCKNLTDEDFYMVGEHFMKQIMGSSHKAMSVMMEKVMGKEGEEEMHAIIGKRMSGCEPTAEYSVQTANMMQTINMMSMMRMMGSNWGGNFSGIHWVGWIWMFLWWAVPLLTLVALIKWILTGSRKK